MVAMEDFTYVYINMYSFCVFWYNMSAMDGVKL